MQDRPNATELTEAVARFLNEELAPTMTDARLRFRVLIAANLMQIVTRELTVGDAPIRAEWQRLAALLGQPADDPPHRTEDLHAEVTALSRALCARIRAGEADEGDWHAAVLTHALASVREKLQIANPRFLQRVDN